MTSYLKNFAGTFVGVGLWAVMIKDTLTTSIKRGPHWGLLLEQFYHVGVLSLPVVAITGFTTGLVLAAQSFYQLADKGLSEATGLFVAKSMLTEVGPGLTAFMVAGRVGSSIAAVIGSMRVTEQIEALKSMAVNPLSYLVAPRILASICMVPLLTIFCAVLGIYGGYLISTFVFGMTPEAYFDPMPAHITPFDIWTGMIKGLVFGFVISTICCYKGLNATGGAEGVGRTITSSVVIAYSMILIFNFMLTMALNILHISYTNRFA